MSAQASRKPVEITIIYLTGLAQGLSLVTFPAAGLRTGSFLSHLDTPCAAYHDAWGLSWHPDGRGGRE